MNKLVTTIVITVKLLSLQTLSQIEAAHAQSVASLSSSTVRPEIIETYNPHAAAANSVITSCGHLFDSNRYAICESDIVSQYIPIELERFMNSLTSRERELYTATNQYWDAWKESYGTSMPLTDANLSNLYSSISANSRNERLFAYKMVSIYSQSDAQGQAVCGQAQAIAELSSGYTSAIERSLATEICELMAY